MKRYLLTTCFLCIVSLIAGPVYAASLQDIEQAIQQRGARWVAGENSVWNRSDIEKQRLVGTILEGTNRDAKGKGQFVALPTSFDWRSQNIVTSIKDQGNCGGCWAFASVAALESLLLINHSVTAEPDLSEQFLVSYDIRNRGCNGGTLSAAAAFLEKQGTPSEACKPYQATSRKMPFPCSDWKDQAAGIGAFESVEQTVDALKAAVYKGPVPTGFYVFEDFYAYTGGVYSHVSGKKVGGHAVLVVGWDDVQQCFIVKNSWGPDWGEHGYFRIAYSEMTTDVAFGTDTVSYVEPWMLEY